ncbi:MAG: hypothetical protein QOH06_5373 [Acidobacteriota bacterium]|nr:hypothetical protein [Acidobacteriota bacterium]
MRAHALTASVKGPSLKAGTAPASVRPEVRHILHAPLPQPKLTVGAPGDAYEREADQVADQVMRMPEPGVQRMCSECEEEREGQGVVQRMCAECEEEMHAKEEPGRTPSVPGGFEPRFAALRGSGQPPSAAERSFFEPRFGNDFAGVRLHTGPAAGELARSVHARAFTLGDSIVFGSGQYSPGTSAGRRLLAHELAHTVQQSGGARRVQRFVSCETGEECPQRAGGEIGRASGAPMFVGSVSGPYQGLLVANFAVGGGDLKRDLQNNPIWANFWGQMVTNPNIRWEILGFSDCSGDEPQNEQLRWQRAIAVNNALPQLARNQVDRFTAAPLTDCMASNADEQGRTYNRSVFIRQVSTEYTFPDQNITRTLPTGPFLDLQIACVTDQGGCANPAGIPALDRQCRSQTGYRGQPLMVLDLVCGTPGLGIAQSLDRAYPTWRSVIPSCPCSRAAAEAAPNFSHDLNPFLSSFHPGADTSFRSDPVASVPGTAHRQQCCYTRSGMLITSGGGAGTPDVWGPFSRHQRIDVQPFNEFNRSFQIYNRFWVPDPGVGCAASDPCVNSCEQAFESCGEGMSCLGQRATCLENCRP